MPKKQVRKSRAPKKAAPSPRSSRQQPKAAVESPKKAANNDDIVAQVAQTILAALGGRQESSPAALAQAELQLFPPETTFSDEPDYSQAASFSPSNGNWESPHNNPKLTVTEENMLAFRGHTDAKIEVLMNRLKTVETMVSHLLGAAKARGR